MDGEDLCFVSNFLEFLKKFFTDQSLLRKKNKANLFVS